jgi:hypothetical protein
LVDEHCNVFHIETALNSRMFSDGYDILTRNEDEFSFMDRMKWEAMKRTFGNLPRARSKKLLHQIPAQYELIACYAGATEPSPRKDSGKNYQQFEIPVKGQCDILITGIPDISPYNVYSSLNPILVQVMALGYHFNMYRNKPLLRKGGVMIITHPCFDEFDPKFHPSYIEFFHRLLPESRDAFYLREKYEREFAENPAYIECIGAATPITARTLSLCGIGAKTVASTSAKSSSPARKTPTFPQCSAGNAPTIDRSDCDGAFVSGQKRRDYDAASADDRAL